MRFKLNGQWMGLLARCVILFVFPAMMGCYHYAPVQVTVVNGVTHQPIPGAQVSVAYLYYATLIHPDTSWHLTDSQGVTQVRVAQGRLGTPFDGIRAQLDGYCPAEARPSRIEPNRAAVAAQLLAERKNVTLTLIPIDEWRDRYGRQSTK